MTVINPRTASGKWCPFVRLGAPDLDPDQRDKLTRKQWGNRTNKGNLPVSIDGGMTATCIGSDCMAWRALSEDHGYCGLAGPVATTTAQLPVDNLAWDNAFRRKVMEKTRQFTDQLDEHYKGWERAQTASKTDKTIATEGHLRHTGLKDIGDDTMLTPRAVMSLFNISRTTLYKMTADGRLPKPIRFGARVPRWKVGDLRSHIDRNGSDDVPELDTHFFKAATRGRPAPPAEPVKPVKKQTAKRKHGR